MMLTRLMVVCGMILIGGVCGCDDTSQPQAQAPPTVPQPEYAHTIVAMGDSLTAGYNVSESEAYPALLEQKLHATGYHQWRVVNAGISGETSSGALARLDWVLKLKPRIIILETGANDGLRGLDTDLIRENIRQIVKKCKANEVTVILAGMQMFHNLGSEYAQAFGAVYANVAKEEGIARIPFFLKEVAGKSHLNQADGIHPTADGYKIVARTVYPFVKKAVDDIVKARRS